MIFTIVCKNFTCFYTFFQFRIPFRILEDNEGVEILLVKNKKNEWRFPGKDYD
jgi:hypothetical protein